MNTLTTLDGKPRQRQRFNKHADYSECLPVLKRLVFKRFTLADMAFEMMRRGIKAPGGGTTWHAMSVSRALVALGLGRH